MIVVDIDRASIDALGTGPWPRETMARLVEAVATGRHPDATPAWQLQHYSGDLGQRPGASSSALVMPSIAAMAWRSKRRGAALAGWLVWILTLAFALSAGIGFASINISDTLTARASRTAPAVTAAQTALGDAMASRDRECRGGVGRYCREREQAVADRRQALDAAMQTVAQAADPQAVAAVKLVSWSPLARSCRARTISACSGSPCSACSRNSPAS